MSLIWVGLWEPSQSGISARGGKAATRLKRHRKRRLGDEAELPPVFAN